MVVLGMFYVVCNEIACLHDLDGVWISSVVTATGFHYHSMHPHHPIFPLNML